MVWRLYALPVIGSGSGRLDPRRPKYVNEQAQLAGVPWAMMDYGHNPGCLMATDVTNAQRDLLAGFADVRLIPLTLDSQIGAALATVQSGLEALQVPAGWAQSTTTWRELVRAVGGLFQFAQRYAGISNGQELIPAGTNLNNTFGSITQARQDAVRATADSFGYDHSGIVAGTTLRAALKILGDQWGDDPFLLGGMTF